MIEWCNKKPIRVHLPLPATPEAMWPVKGGKYEQIGSNYFFGLRNLLGVHSAYGMWVWAIAMAFYRIRFSMKTRFCY